MSFEYRELSSQVFLQGEKGDKSPCRGASCNLGSRECRGNTGDEDECCAETCDTTTQVRDSIGCPEDDREKRYAAEYREGLSQLHQQLRDRLEVG